MTSIRALVVDDSKVMRDLVRSCLESLGAEVTVADSAEAGLWTFQTLDPDLVVSDIRMAAMTGIELSRRIKEQSRGRVHVLLISSSDQSEGRDAVARGDADAFLAKPVDWKALEETVKRLLGDPTHGRQPAVARVREKIGVVVADDTEVGRRLIARALDADPDFEIVETVADGRAAVEAAERRRPRLVLLDVLLPRLDAPEATRMIMLRAPTRVVILTRDTDPRGATAALEATRAGALDVLIPPAFCDPMAAPAVTFRDRLKELAEVPVVRRWYAQAGRGERPSEARAPRPTQDARPVGAKLVAICGSTGGPGVLATLLARLAPHVGGASVLVVQHVLEGFAGAFADWLTEAARIPVRVAKDGDALEPGVIAIAPDGRHLAVASRTRMSVIDSPPVEAHRPSGTILFESVARAFGAEAIGVILTGMGRDGVAGLRSLRANGGFVLAQSPDTCVVPGMPAAAIEEGLAHLVVSPDDLADEIVARLARPG